MYGISSIVFTVTTVALLFLCVPVVEARLREPLWQVSPPAADGSYKLGTEGFKATYRTINVSLADLIVFGEYIQTLHRTPIVVQQRNDSPPLTLVSNIISNLEEMDGQDEQSALTIVATFIPGLHQVLKCDESRRLHRVGSTLIRINNSRADQPLAPHLDRLIRASIKALLFDTHAFLLLLNSAEAIKLNNEFGQPSSSSSYSSWVYPLLGGAVAVVTFFFGLLLIGFTTAGITAGSLAAWLMSYGITFPILQSIAMGGLSLASWIGVFATGVFGGILVDWFDATNDDASIQWIQCHVLWI
jgi:hypothetical protein